MSRVFFKYPVHRTFPRLHEAFFQKSVGNFAFSARLLLQKEQAEVGSRGLIPAACCVCGEPFPKIGGISAFFTGLLLQRVLQSCKQRRDHTVLSGSLLRLRRRGVEVDPSVATTPASGVFVASSLPLLLQPATAPSSITAAMTRVNTFFIVKSPLFFIIAHQVGTFIEYFSFVKS